MSDTTERGARETRPDALDPTIAHPPEAEPLQPGPTVDLDPPAEVAIREAGHGALDPRSLPTSTRALTDCERLGRYRIVGRLGVGGMGEVFKVVDPAIGREVAAKVILGQATRDQIDRFALEAQVTGQLEHPNIVPVHEFGQTAGDQLYFTMKRVDGVGLDELLDEVREGRRELPLGERLQIVMKVCDAVAFAHSRGVVHRDLKPANVMVGRFGEVQLMDWGLAKILDQPDRVAERLRPSMEDTVSGMTLDGAVKGTPAYMPPEQALGEVDRIDERSDVYSLGALLYEMLTLRPPYEGDVMVVLDQVAEGLLVPPRQRAADVPWELEVVILKAMATAPEARYASAEAMREDLSSYVGGGMLSAAQYTAGQWFGKWVARNKVTAAVVFAVGLVGALALVALERQKRETRARQQAERQRAVQTLVGRVDAQLAKVPASLATAFEAATTSGPPVGADARWSPTLSTLLRVSSALDRGLMLDPASTALRARRRAVGEQLVRAASLSGDFAFAAQAAADLGRFDASAEQVARLREAVGQVRTARLRRRREAVTRMIADVRGGLANPDRVHATWSFDDYVFGAVSYGDGQTVGLFNEVLARLVARARKDGLEAQWSQGDRELVRYSAAVLTRLVDQPGAIDRLVELLELLGDQELVADVGVALCNTRRPEVHRPLVKVLNRWGPNSVAWQRIRPAFNKVPEPGMSKRDGHTEAEFLRARMRVRIEAGRWSDALDDSERLGAIDQRGLRDWVDHGRILFALGRNNEALGAYEVALRGQEHAEVYNLRAGALSALGRHDEALKALDRAMALQPSADGYHNRAVVLRRLGRLTEALRDLDRALGMGHKRPESVHRERGLLLYEMGRYHEGIRSLSASLDQERNQPHVLNVRARMRLRMGELGAAMSDVQLALRLDPTNVAALCCRAMIRVRTGVLTAARDDVEAAVRLRPGDTIVLKTRAQVRLAQGEVEGALADLSLGLGNARTPKERNVVLLARAELYRRTNRAREALRDLDAAIGQMDTYEARASRSVVRYAAGDLQGALTDAARAVEMAPEYGAARLNYGQLLFAGGKLAEALEHLDAACKLSPREGKAWHYRGLVRSRQGDADGALADYGKAIAVDPKNVQALVNRGDLLFRARRYAEAREDFVKATRQAPSLWQAWAGLGQTLLRLKDKPGAAAALRRAIAGAPQRVQPGLRQLLTEAGG